MESELGQEKSRIEDLVRVGCISFDFLWAIFEGIRLYYAVDEHGMRHSGMVLSCTCTNFDSKNVGRKVKYPCEIRENEAHDGTEITALKCHPLEYEGNQEEILDRFRKRHEKFMQLRDTHVMRYQGLLEVLR